MKHVALTLKDELINSQKLEKPYKILRKHLNTLPVGLPATPTGVERRLLKAMFSIDEARLAKYMDWHFETADAVFRKAGKALGRSKDEVVELLTAMDKKGTIYAKNDGGVWRYALHPLLIGMYEMQLPVITPGYYLDLRQYVTQFMAIEYLTTAIPQLRVVPVEKSVTTEHNIATYDEIRAIIENTDQEICLAECICRKANQLIGKPCSVTDRKESCITLGHFGAQYIRNGWGRAITKEEALDVLKQSEKEGLVLQPSNEKSAEFICCCCGCCCGILELLRIVPHPADFCASNFYVTLDTQSCNGCGKCVTRCQMNAFTIKNKKAVLDAGKCIGCGLCVTTCKTGSLKLVKKDIQTTPPDTIEDKFEVIMAGKKGSVGKLMSAAKGVMGLKP